MRWAVLLTLVGALSSLCARAGAQEAFTLTGQVTEQGRPFGGVTVLAGDLTAVTNGDGIYGFELPADDYTVEINLHGYKPVSQKVTVKDGETATLNLALEPMLQVVSVTAPPTLTQGSPGDFTVQVKNDSAAAYSLDVVSLQFAQGTRDVTGEYTVEPDSGNPATVPGNGQAALKFRVTPSATAAAGPVSVSASLFAYDTEVGTGKNLVSNPSFETLAAGGGAKSWGFGQDGNAGASGGVARGVAMTGANSFTITYTGDPADARGYSDQTFNLQPGVTYVLSGYVKTELGDALEQPNSGADVYAPIVRNVPYIQPEAPYVKGTADWRKTMVTIAVSEDADNPEVHVRGQIYAAKGTAWFDNLSLSEAEEDGSLTVTGGAATFTLAGATVAAPVLQSPAADARVATNPPAFSWEPVAGVTGYEIEIASNANFDSPVAKGSPTEATFTPSQPLPLGQIYWRVRAVSAVGASPWSQGSYFQTFTPKLTLSASGPKINPGGQGTVTVTASNTDVAAYNVDAVGLTFAAGSQDVTDKYQVTPDEANPTVVPAGGQVSLKLQVTAASDAPAGTVSVTPNLFGYNTGIGTGANLLVNPSLERGEYALDLLPENWTFVNDLVSDAVHEWLEGVAHTGQRSVRLDKIAPEHQSYIQQELVADSLQKLKPNTAYTFSGWVRTQDLPEGGSAGLLLWYNDGVFHPSTREELRGTNGWTKLVASFTTSDQPTTQVLARGNVFGVEGGSAWFDDFAVSEGTIDGSVWAAGPASELGGAPPPPPATKGDLNNNNKLDIQDVLVALRIVAGLLPATPVHLAAGDLNGNGKIDITEVIQILRAVAGLATL